ncbi:hypothetical protein Bbelb_256230 [Branchiostoma belcheri]|nr:hypothetical protein Bbelb_256230 [Branchiostoma belcheri]
MLIDVSSDFKTTQLAAGVSERGCGTPVARTLRGPTAFGSRRIGARRALPTGRSAGHDLHWPAAQHRGIYRGAPLVCRRGTEEPTKDRLKKVNLRHAARDTLLFYTGHRYRHICPVCAKLPAPANDAGFRTVETISVHGEGFTLHGDKHNSYSRIQLRSGTKYQVNFAMSTLRCRLGQEFTG